MKNVKRDPWTAAKPTLTKVMVAKLGTRAKTWKGVKNNFGLKTEAKEKGFFLSGILISAETNFRKIILKKLGNISTAKDRRQSYWPTMTAAAKPAKAPPAGTPAILNEKSVPQILFGVFAAKIMLPAGAEIAYPKPTSTAATKPTHPFCKAKVTAANDARIHPKISDLNEPKLGKIVLLAAKNHTAPKPPSPPINPTASGGSPDEAVITGANTETPWFIAARENCGRKTAKKAKMIDRNA